MTSKALPPDVGYADIARRMGDIGPTPEMGQGFGLGFVIQTPTGLNSAYRHAFRNLTYAAMTGSEPAR